MKWEESLKHQLYADGRKRSYEKLYRISRLAYLKGCSEEKKKALEAYRLCCSRLFGNRCMPSIGSSLKRKKLCDADCPYIRKYEFELYKLGGCAESTPE
ncbi:hypothetical protein [uncultured Bacteroides sp.]|uniref:hypothetical protein n=1 Tax=uncultured Bacteroides sp. TaxID=162156 RepID=UPI0025A9C903|nr:hypothetical protein [uncultured Bacteroides sp.]